MASSKEWQQYHKTKKGAKRLQEENKKKKSKNDKEKRKNKLN